ncbi:hypothetical protein PC129_g21672 [Phytophthora cactorum]|uniref:Uncharacterized protein n=1 Tax=Phytophthora cactorum TaxID=29920 RepID=A0A8T0YBV1_9STRA|nr:hypothetical protein Pcac1_g11765 [Phytophthora cactorum]KAG2796521.1 hypothetical protein PC111_g21688 [Phytophthora cactorum]KAG2796653.1 hypothetical protein PC112_g22111 [Phytophthora cactorum]KAG2825135.1 hypothetical protein PC113_g21944 [Phytophthora cactorum]KAG2877602.1 hypothetical protein PC114_g23534 [Phytophthora cactorum]
MHTGSSIVTTELLGHRYAKLSGTANLRFRKTASSIADLVDGITELNDHNQEKNLLQLVRQCVNAKQCAPLYNANHIETVTGLVRNGQTYFAKLYALQRLKWSVISDAKMSQIDFNIHRGCVKEAPERDLVSVASALQTGTDEEKEEQRYGARVLHRARVVTSCKKVESKRIPQGAAVK